MCIYWLEGKIDVIRRPSGIARSVYVKVCGSNLCILVKLFSKWIAVQSSVPALKSKAPLVQDFLLCDSFDLINDRTKYLPTCKGILFLYAVNLPLSGLYGPFTQFNINSNTHELKYYTRQNTRNLSKTSS